MLNGILKMKFFMLQKLEKYMKFSNKKIVKLKKKLRYNFYNVDV